MCIRDRILNTSLLFALASSALAAPTLAQQAPKNWSGWLGADHGVVTDGGPPTVWDEETNVSWKVPVPGRGLSSPVVVDGIIYLTTAVPTQSEETKSAPETDGESEGQAEDQPQDGRGGRRGPGGRPGGDAEGRRGGRGGGPGGRMAMTEASEQEFRLLALDLETGKTLWSKLATTLTPHEGTHADGSFATPTVAVSGDHIIASFGSFGIFAYNKAGEELWSVDLGDQTVRGSFGEGTSPVIGGGNVIILWGHSGDSFLVALDLETGKEAWRQVRAKGTNWSTPTVTKVGDLEQVIVVGLSTQAYDAKTGELVWSIGGDGKPSEEAEPDSGRRGRSNRGPIATPLVANGRLITTVGGRRGSIISVVLDSDAEDKGLDSERIAWKHDGDTPGIPTPLAIEGTLYVLKDGGQLGAFDVNSGEAHYTGERLEAVGSAYASLVATPEHIYLTGRDGSFEVVQAGKEFKSIAVNMLDDKFDATPAIVGDRLLLRGFHSLYCIAAPSKE